MRSFLAILCVIFLLASLVFGVMWGLGKTGEYPARITTLLIVSFLLFLATGIGTFYADDGFL